MNEPSPLDEILLDMVKLIPPGSLTSYSDLSILAAALGYPCTPRRAARTMSLFGAGVPWWRVVQAGGTVADQVAVKAAPLLAADGVPVNGKRVPLERRRWSPRPEELRDRLTAAATDPRAMPPPG